MLNSFKKNVFLKNFSTFNIGGPASYFCLINNQRFEGIVILNKINHLNISKEGLITVGSGYSFSHLCYKISSLNFSGLEFGVGIPGSVGGAVYMNAGAHALDTSQHLTFVTYINENLEIKKEKKENLNFGYRKSCFQKSSFFIMEACFQVNNNSSFNKKNIITLNKKRCSSQPLKYKSAGCIFKNPNPNISAGFLIDSCGLKGLAKGDAEISRTHANFIINKGKASAKDVLYLIEKIKTTVFNKTGILLEEEIKIIPYKK